MKRLFLISHTRPRAHSWQLSIFSSANPRFMGIWLQALPPPPLPNIASLSVTLDNYIFIIRAVFIWCPSFWAHLTTKSTHADYRPKQTATLGHNVTPIPSIFFRWHFCYAHLLKRSSLALHAPNLMATLDNYVSTIPITSFHGRSSHAHFTKRSYRINQCILDLNKLLLRSFTRSSFE